jgi:hypothetical protein
MVHVCATVVVLEDKGGLAALRRSRALGKGYYLRNISLITLLYLPVICSLIVVFLSGLAQTFQTTSMLV